MQRYRLHSICVEACCPNREICFQRGNITFLILGNICTRNCRFCAVKKGRPREVDPGEPERIAKAVAELNPRHIVITSVTRDDLPDGGAYHFAEVSRRIKERLPHIILELLVPDFQGNPESFEILFEAPFTIFGHNLETVPRLYPLLRPMANYDRSLKVLIEGVKRGICTKTGIMVGCGERVEEVEELLKDVAEIGVSIVTIGQYLQPSKRAIPTYEYIPSSLFEHYATFGQALGLRVFSAPLVRSSFIADLTEKELTALTKGGFYGIADNRTPL